MTDPLPGPRSLRIGIDTGGTFTDVVAFDEATGDLVTTKTPSTPADPAEGFLTGIEKILRLLGADVDRVAAGAGEGRGGGHRVGGNGSSACPPGPAARTRPDGVTARGAALPGPIPQH